MTEKNSVYEMDGTPIEIATDIGYALFELATFMVDEKISQSGWNDTLSELMKNIEGSVKAAHESEVQL